MRIDRYKGGIALVLGTGVFLTLIPLVFLEFGRPGLEGLSIAASSFLTLGLVVLYSQQRRLLQYQQMPHLEISDFSMVGNFELVQVDISNVGGGPATSMKLRIDLYELSGEGPLRTARGGLRRIESLGDGTEKKTRASSVRPSEVSIPFEAESKRVLAFGSSTHNQDSLAGIVAKELKKDRDVVYGKVSIEYLNKFSERDTHEADFSLKFTRQDELQFEMFDLQPWKEENQQFALGG